jgi:ATP-dependent DNA helicase RecQ
LLLLSAHRAKGLEFDHVVVLDGGWFATHDDVSAQACQAEQRLYYVAMTRARQTLTLCQMSGGPHLRAALQDSPAVLWRDAVLLGNLPTELYWQFFSATLKEVDIGFAGRHAGGHVIHQHIAALSPGDALALVQQGQHWLLHDAQGHPIGRMSASFALPAGRACQRISVRAVLQRRRDQTDAEYQHLYPVDRWELVLPELVLV